MQISSVSYKNGTVKIKFIKNEEIFTLVSEEKPHPDFINAIKDLSPIMRRFLQVNPDRIDKNFCNKECDFVKYMNERVFAYGVSITVKEGDGNDRVKYKIQGGIEIASIRNYVEIESLPLTHDPHWYEYTTKTGTKVHTPNDSPTYLTDSELATIEKVVKATGDFVNGVRDQGTLDINESEIKEDAIPLNKESELFEEIPADSPYEEVVEF